MTWCNQFKFLVFGNIKTVFRRFAFIQATEYFFLKIKKDFRDCRQITFALHNRFCPLSENPPTSLLLMGYSRKKPNRGLRIWKFQGIKKMTCGISRALGFWPWNFQVILHNFVKFPWVELCFGVKAKKGKIPGGFSKKWVLNPPLWVFSGIGQWTRSKWIEYKPKIKWKIHAFYTLYFKFQRYFFWKCVRYNHQIFYFLLFLLALTSGGTIFCKFLELHSTMSDKKIFVINLSLLTDPLKLPSPPPPHPTTPLTTKIC